jgi:hypothetical protein
MPAAHPTALGRQAVWEGPLCCVVSREERARSRRGGSGGGPLTVTPGVAEETKGADAKEHETGGFGHSYAIGTGTGTTGTSCQIPLASSLARCAEQATLGGAQVAKVPKSYDRARTTVL